VICCTVAVRIQAHMFCFVMLVGGMLVVWQLVAAVIPLGLITRASWLLGHSQDLCQSRLST
jgi:hypothetical protein